MSSDVKSLLSEIFQLRLLVGFLGERAQCGWWPTAFYEPSGRLFLEPIFSKTSQVAQYHGVVEAARRLHDEHLSVGGYHLFRLSEEMEQDLHAWADAGLEELFPAVHYQDKDTALDALADMTGAAKKDGVGPVSIGNVGNIAGHLKEIASVYHSAFLAGTQSFPYLAG